MNGWKSRTRSPVMLVMLNFSNTQNLRFFSFLSSYVLINVSYCAYQASEMDTFTGMMKITITTTGTQAIYQTAVMTGTQWFITAAEMMDYLRRPFIFQLTLPSFCSSLVTISVSMFMVPFRERNSFVGTVKTNHRRLRQNGTIPSWRSIPAKIWKCTTVIINGDKDKS